MKLSGTDTHELCDDCGRLICMKSVHIVENGRAFCGWRCAENAKKDGGVSWRCSLCANPLGAVAPHWIIQDGPVFVPVFCKAECKRDFVLEINGAKVQDWIPVDVRLPEFDIPVLVYIGDIPNQLNGPQVKAGLYPASLYGETGKEHLHRWGLQFSGFVGFECVTHWRPLPEPPIVEQERKQGHCRDCQHWDDSLLGEAYQGEMAVCKVLTYSASPYVQNRSNLFAKAGQYFVTSKGFGCLEFQSKEER